MYDELYQAWKNEKEAPEVQKLSRDFYSKLAAYIKRLKAESRMLDKKTVKAKLLDRELENVRTMTAGLLHCRHEKFLLRTLSRETAAKEAMADEEKRLYGELLQLRDAYIAFSKSVLRGDLSSNRRATKQGMVVLRFVRETPAIVGSDLNTYGPFLPEDVATLPPENARILVRESVAVEVDVG